MSKPARSQLFQALALMWVAVWAVLVALCFLFPQARAGVVTLAGMNGGTASYFRVHVASIQQRKFETVVHQQYDYSCGSAALATLLTYQYQDPVTEAAVFKSMWDRGDQAKIRKEGFSLLDIKDYLENHGYQANGYEASLEKLAQVGVPAIVLIKDNGYNHFVVIKGIENGQVLVGDPSMGLRTIPIAVFEKMWPNRIVFVIDNESNRAMFNGKRDWGLQPLAPLGLAMGANNLANVTLLRPGLDQF